MPENIRTAGGSPMPKKRKAFGQKKNGGAQEEYKTSKGYKEKIVPGNMDLSFLIIVLILLVIGIVMMFSASYAWAIYERRKRFQRYLRASCKASITSGNSCHCYKQRILHQSS